MKSPINNLIKRFSLLLCILVSLSLTTKEDAPDPIIEFKHRTLQIKDANQRVVLKFNKYGCKLAIYRNHQKTEKSLLVEGLNENIIIYENKYNIKIVRMEDKSFLLFTPISVINENFKLSRIACTLNQNVIALEYTNQTKNIQLSNKKG